MSLNTEIAAIFNTMADVLEIQDANAFKVRAYRNAVRILENLEFSIADLLSTDKKVAGIGAALSDKIKEYCKTGKMHQYDELLADVPSGLLEMLNIASFGPKRVKLVYQKLGVDSVEKLEQAAAQGKIQLLEGMGLKSEAKILKNIRDFRTLQTKRIFWPQADKIIKRFKSYLSKITSIDQLEIAGSYRRCRESVGDLDVLATSDGDPIAIIQQFVDYDDVIEILAQGSTKASVILKEKIQVDFRVVAPDKFGAALQYFTGSKEHNVAIRKIAKSQGLKLSEYGVFKDDVCIASKTETEIYNALGLQYVPPEIRENQGEVEAAIAHSLPKLIEAKDIKGVLHMHTTYSDGHASIADMARAAVVAGYDYIAITDHSKSLTAVNGLSDQRLLAQIEEIKALRLVMPEINIISGVECDILTDGSLDYSDQILSQLDFVIAAIHTNLDLNEAEMTARITKGVSNPLVDCFAHPTGRRLGSRLPYKIKPDILVQLALDYNVMLEINASPYRMDLNDAMARQARVAGVRLVINSDAHSTDQLAMLDYGINIARRAGCRPADIINTYNYKNLFDLINKGKNND